MFILYAISAWVCTFCALWANLIDEIVSSIAYSLIEHVTINLVIELPINDYFNILVSFDSL
jgi:hypothetical protein